MYFLGSYSFIDPKHKIRTVQYTADENGFHASLINYEDTVVQPIDSETDSQRKNIFDCIRR